MRTGRIKKLHAFVARAPPRLAGRYLQSLREISGSVLRTVASNSFPKPALCAHTLEQSKRMRVGRPKRSEAYETTRINNLLSAIRRRFFSTSAARFRALLIRVHTRLPLPKGRHHVLRHPSSNIVGNSGQALSGGHDKSVVIHGVAHGYRS